MRRIISFVHISLDGFVAGPNGEMNWITINEEIFEHVGKRINKGDTALYGRVTFDMMEGYWPTAGQKPNASDHDRNHSKWYSEVHKIVLSRSLAGTTRADMTVISDNLADRIRAIKEAPGSGEDILVFGSPGATHALLQENLIDGYWFFVNPVVLGTGIPLFKNVQDKMKLEFEGTHVFKCGVVELRYGVKGR